MRSREIWLTVLMRGVQLKSLTRYHRDTTAPISYTQCYKIGLPLTNRVDNYLLTST